MRWSRSHWQSRAELPRAEERSRLTAECPAKLGQSAQGRVLAGALQPVQRRLAHPEPLGHLDLTQARVFPHPSEHFRQLSSDIHAPYGCGKSYSHVHNLAL